MTQYVVRPPFGRDLTLQVGYLLLVAVVDDAGDFVAKVLAFYNHIDKAVL